MRLWECMGFLNNKIIVSIDDFPFIWLFQLTWCRQNWCILNIFKSFIFFTDIMTWFCRFGS